MAKKVKTVEKWLEDYIKTNERLQRISSYSDEINCCGRSSSEVHVYRGIRKIAEALGEEVVVTERNDDTYPIELSFKYKLGNKTYKVFQLEEEGRQK